MNTDTDTNSNTHLKVHTRVRGEGREGLVTRAVAERNRVHTSATARPHIRKTVPESVTNTTAGSKSRLLRKKMGVCDTN